jgi:multiple sugar transport system permease protein
MQVRSTAVTSRGRSSTGAVGWIRRTASRYPLYLVLILLSIVFAFPLFWTISSSLKTGPEWYVFPPKWLPDSPQWGNYLRVFRLMRYPYGRWVFNSFFIVIMATSGTLVTGSLVAYGFARFPFRGRDALFLATLSTMMIPSSVTLIPQFILFHRLGWTDTPQPLWVPTWFGGGAFYIFLMRQFFMTLPRELDEAALIDGAGYFRIFWNVLLPLCRPVLATVGIISFMAHWSDFMGPLIYLNSNEKFTVSVGLQFFQEAKDIGGEPLHHILMAGTALSIIPCILLFFGTQRYFVRGIVMTGLKG